MTRAYNGFTPKQIEHWSRRQYKALEKAPERRVKVCQACGIACEVASDVEQHLEDYRQPLDGIIGLCIRCHVVTHGRFDHPQVWDKYLAMVREGSLFPVLHHGATARSEMFNGRRGFDAATPGPERGRTVLDDIGDGRWLEVGLAENDVSTGSCCGPDQHAVGLIDVERPPEQAVGAPTRTADGAAPPASVCQGADGSFFHFLVYIAIVFFCITSGNGAG